MKLNKQCKFLYIQIQNVNIFTVDSYGLSYQSHPSLPHFFLKALFSDVIINAFAHYFCPSSYLASPEDGNSTAELTICRSRYSCKLDIIWHIFFCLCLCSANQITCADINFCPKAKSRSSSVDTISFICEYSAIRTEIYINKSSSLWFVLSHPQLLPQQTQYCDPV